MTAMTRLAQWISERNWREVLIPVGYAILAGIGLGVFSVGMGVLLHVISPPFQWLLMSYVVFLVGGAPVVVLGVRWWLTWMVVTLIWESLALAYCLVAMSYLAAA